MQRTATVQVFPLLASAESRFCKDSPVCQTGVLIELLPTLPESGCLSMEARMTLINATRTAPERHSWDTGDTRAPNGDRDSASEGSDPASLDRRLVWSKSCSCCDSDDSLAAGDEVRAPGMALSREVRVSTSLSFSSA